MTSAAELTQAALAASGPIRDTLFELANDQLLRERIVACTECELHAKCTAPVPWEGKSDIAIIGEAPGASEDRAGRPFVGQSGHLLDECLQIAGFKRSEIAFINTIACRPPNNNFDNAVKADAPYRCRPLFTDQVKASGAWLLVPVGNTALHQLIASSGGITDLRGRMFWRDHHLIMPTFHPAYALRNPQAKAKITEDLQQVRRVWRASREAPVPKSYDPTRLLDTMRASKYSPEDRKAINSTFKKKGWVMAYSNWVDDMIVLRRDDNVIVPESINGVQYTVAELVQLAAVGNRTWADARRLHYAKREFEGAII